MKIKNVKLVQSNLLLLIVAVIWGGSFIAQRAGMSYMGPFTYNGVRFALGSISLLPLIMFDRRKSGSNTEENTKKALQYGFIAGLILFAGASLQQVGIVTTTAGKAAFISGFYIILVPVFGIFRKQYIGIRAWIGALLAVAGLYLLSMTGSFYISNGDLLELAGSFFWALQIVVIGRYSSKVDVLKLSFFQLITCSVLSLCTAAMIEKITIDGLMQAAVPVLYGGIFSVGIAYTLQIVGQKNTKPAYAAIILSMETVFASIGGFLLLNESLSIRGYAGCILMLTGMLLAQARS